MVLGIIGLAVSIVAAYLAWRAIVKADDANKIAAKALAISEREEAARIAEREARARLSVSVGIDRREPGADGVIRIGGSHGQCILAIEIRNDGDRAAGRTLVEASFPLSISNASTYWSQPDGRELFDHKQRASRRGETNVLALTLDGVSRGVPEYLFAAFPVVVPSGDDVQPYPIRVRVVAESAEPTEVVEDFPLRIGHGPNG